MCSFIKKMNKLINAIKNNNLDEVRCIILNEKININEKYDFTDDSALHFASIYGNLEAMKILIEFGANINQKNYNNETSLHYAVYNGRLEIVKFLITLEININEKNNYGVSPLRIASYGGYFEIVKILVENCANITIGDINSIKINKIKEFLKESFEIQQNYYLLK